MNVFRAAADCAILRHRFSHLRPDAIRRLQWREIRRLLAWVRAKSPFYRALYEGMDVASLEDYGRLPTIDKATMMEHFDTLNTEGLRRDALLDYAIARELAHEALGTYAGRFVVGLSSGTSGARGLYVTPRALTARLPGAFLARGGIPWRLLPWRILFLLRVFSQGFADLRSPLVSLTYMNTMSDPAEIIARMTAERINVLMAPPSLLRVLAPHAADIRTMPRWIVSCAEVLAPEEKARLEQAFGCCIVDLYQASEGQIGSACPRGTLHINEDLVYVELLDDHDAPVTEPGAVARRMVVTNLVNRVQPLLRYEMNDLVELGEPCACGSSFRTIARVLGRHDEVFEFETPSGTRPVFPDLISRWLLTATDGIREFRATQEPDGTVDLAIESLAGADQEAIRRALETRFRAEFAALGITAAVRVAFGPIPIPADRSKLRRFTRRAGAGFPPPTSN